MRVRGLHPHHLTRSPLPTPDSHHARARPQFMAWDTAARRHIDLVGRKDDGDKVIAREFDFSKVNQVGRRC